MFQISVVLFLAKNMVVPMGHFILPPIFLRWGREKMEKSLKGGDWGTVGKGMAGTS